MSDPLVSVVMTCYNHEPWVEESIESMLSQTYRNWELIAVDNGSTDKSAKVIERYRGHPQVTVVRYERNTCVCTVANRAIRMARGKYFSLLYADDYYLPHKLDHQVAMFETLPQEYGVVYSTGHRLMPDGRLYPIPCGLHRGNVLRQLLTEPQFFAPIAPLVLREALLKYPFNETIFWEGEGIYVKLALGYHFNPLPEPVVVMRDHPMNMGKEIWGNLGRDLRMLEHLFGRPDFPPELQYLKGISLGNTYSVGGWQAIRRERQYKKGREWLRLAVQNNPKSLRKPRVLAGLVIGSLPKPLADASMDVLDRVMGAPPPPVSGPENPVDATPSPEDLAGAGH